jgi:hypothetical protein
MAKKEDEIIKENEEIKKTQKEFDEKKKILEDRMINGLLGYVRDGTFPKSTISNYASNMDCHDIIYNYTDKNIGDYILNYHNEKITQSTTECYEKIKNLSGLDFIDSFIDCTDKLNLFIYTMARVFLYITTNHLKASEDKNNVRIYTQDDISEFSMDIFKKTFFNKLMTKLFDTLNELLIRDERNGNMEHRQKIKAIMKTISSLDLVKPKIHKKSATSFTWLEMAKDHKENREYQDKWYDNFKKETKKYLNNKSDKDIKNSSAPEYVKCQLKYLNEEEERQESYIYKAYHNDLRNINYEYLIRRNMNTLVEMDTGINNMFKIKKKDQLSEIFQLFSFVPESLELIQKSFRAYIKERLLALYNDKDFSKDPKKFVPALINLKKEMDEIVQMCFDNHNDFQDAENKEFSLVMSKELYPKQLANYADFCMRNGFKGKSEEEIENTLNDIISIFKNINSKLVFQNETEKKMSDRLIKLSSLSINAEKIFISKLKQESGVTYVSKMQEMINDLEKNKGESEGYKLTKSRGAPGGVKFNVQVISQSAWDVQKTHMEKIEIPKFLKNCIDDFETYYIGRHQQTKLLWCLGLSKMEIQYLYLKNKNISTSTLPQFLALYFLEQKTKLNLQQIAQLLGCNVQKVIYDIRGLIFNPNYNTKGQIDKGVILADIDPKTKEFKPSTEISINMNFSVSHQKFNTLPLPQKKTAAEIKASEIEEAQIIKRYQDNILQATITRIMKSRIGQGTTHVWLVNESAKQIDLFKAQPQQIKENIEKLIEKSIIKRNGPSYEYIA